MVQKNHYSYTTRTRGFKEPAETGGFWPRPRSHTNARTEFSLESPYRRYVKLKLQNIP